ncbi:MAG: DNA repair protein RecO [Oscillibacter sp.]|nr:DNA repair protein RecO [Oscillibacter sp.]
MAATPYIVTRGIVLRETETRESDKILTLLTAEYGKLSVIARGARRKNCRFAAAAQTLAFSEWTLYRRGEWCYADEGATIALFEGLRRELPRLALGFYFAELTETVTGSEEESGALLSHLLNGLYALDTLEKPEALVRSAFEFRALALAGYEPLADACAVCGRSDPQEPVLDALQGVVRCRDCAGPDGGRPAPLCAGSLCALRHILYGPPRRLYSFTLAPPALERLSRAAELFVSAQLDRGFQTLDFYKSVRAAEQPSN